MIARTWSGRTKKEHTQAYLKIVRETGIIGLEATPGNQGAWLLHRTDGDETEYLVISLWDSLESIKAFAGDDVDKARYYPQDDSYLLDKAQMVCHYEVAHSACPV